jgi:hypothetical protein
MDKTIKESLQTFVKWLVVSFLTASGLAIFGFWFYLGKAFWYHNSGYLFVATWWLVGTIPSNLMRIYVSIKRNKKK